jgi:hypothetical protein
MRPLSLWRHEARRAGLAALLTPLAVALFMVAIALDSALRLHDPSRNTALILQNLLELALPLAAGVGAASLVGRDPAIELQLTLPTAYRATILRRLAASTGWVAVVALTVTLGAVATGWWDRWPGAHTPLTGQLTWLAPTVFLTGLGLLVGTLAGSPALATSVVAMLWTFHLAGTGPLQNHQWTRQLFLFATTRGVPELDWTANRLILLAAGASLAAVAWLLLRRPVRLLTKEAE